MTPDELRALADCLDDPNAMQRTARRKAADYLRAQADAQPVAHYAMLDSHRRLVEQSIWDAEHPSGMSTHDGKARIDASVLRRMLAIIDSLPAAPQAEPKRDERVIVRRAIAERLRALPKFEERGR